MSKLSAIHRWLDSNALRLAYLFTGLRALSIVLLIMGIPALESQSGFYFHHGGDQDYYYDFAEAIATHNFTTLFAVQAAFPALLALPIRLLAASSYENILPFTVITFGGLLGSLSVLMVYQTSIWLTNNRVVSVLSATVWSVLPLLIWGGFSILPNGTVLKMVNVPLAAWLTILPDGITTFCSIAAVLFTAMYLRQKSLLSLVFSAVSCALVAFLRIQQTPLIFLLVTAFVISTNFSGIITWSSTFFAIYALQIVTIQIHKVSALQPEGFLTWIPTNFYFGVIAIWEDQVLLWQQFNPIATDNLLKLLQPQLLLPLIIGLTILFFALRYIGARVGLPQAILLSGAGIAMIILVVASSVFAQNTIRYTLPGAPFFIIFGLWVCNEIYTVLGQFMSKNKQEATV